MSTQGTLYTKYHEKMKRLCREYNIGNEEFSFIEDAVFDEFSEYFLKTIDKAAEFKLYRYSSLYYKKALSFDFNKLHLRVSGKQSDIIIDTPYYEKTFSLDLNKLHLRTNGKQNDIFEGIPCSDYDIYPINDCINDLSSIALLKCFTETPKNHLMWAHYADGHRGVCIEYDIKRAPLEWKKQLFPVMYQKKPLNFNSVEELFNSKEENGKYDFRDCKGMLLQKPDHWKYELEWRICKMNTEEVESEELDFPCVSKIYLGRRIEEEDKIKIFNIVQEYNTTHSEQIEVYKTKLKENSYDIEFEKLC